MNDNTPAVSTTAATAKAKRIRNIRGNHSVAETHVISDANTAQSYCNAVITATTGENENTMYNGSGFVAPAKLDDQDIANRLRMACSLINSITVTATQDGSEDAEAAQTALNILIDYATNSRQIRQDEINKELEAKYKAMVAAQNKVSTK